MFTDDWTHYTWVYFLRTKDDALQHFQAFKTAVEKRYQFTVCELRTDRGGEYLSGVFHLYCIHEGIHHQLPCAHTPFQNGVAERKNCTVLEMARSLLLFAGLPKGLWEEAVKTVVYLLNRIPTKAVSLTTPFQKLTGMIPDLKHLPIFGCACYVLLTSRHDKLDPKAVPATFLGYDTQSKAYRCHDSATHKIIVSRSVRFNKTKFGMSPRVHKPLLDDQFLFVDDPSSTPSPCSTSLPTPPPPPPPPSTASIPHTTSTTSLPTSPNPSDLPTPLPSAPSPPASPSAPTQIPISNSSPATSPSIPTGEAPWFPSSNSPPFPSLIHSPSTDAQPPNPSPNSTPRAPILSLPSSTSPGLLPRHNPPQNCHFPHKYHGHVLFKNTLANLTELPSSTLPPLLPLPTHSPCPFLNYHAIHQLPHHSYLIFPLKTLISYSIISPPPLLKLLPMIVRL
jgi:hypothetical protein